MTDRATLEKAVLAGMDSASAAAMQWGVDDCALWVANILRDALGYDPAASYRGKYRSCRGAARVLGRGGMLRALRTAARRHKWRRVRPDFAQPGDPGLAWVDAGSGPVLATVVCRAQGWFVGRSERGFTALRADKIAAAWSALPGVRTTGSHVSLVTACAPLPGRPATSAALYEPISAAIGVEALFTAFAAFAATPIGGAIVGFAISEGLSIIGSKE